MFLFYHHVCKKLSNLIFLKTSNMPLMLASVLVGSLISNAFALDVSLQPTLLTSQGIYPISAKLVYEQKDQNVLLPKKAFTGPIIHLNSLPMHFNPGNSPRFMFKQIDTNASLARINNLYFIAAPNGELYPADAPNFNKAKVTINISLTYPAPNIGRPYQKIELDNWRWYPFLIESLRLALEARSKGNHPFGAVMVANEKILARGLNTVNTEKDFTAHAERNLESLASQFPAAVRSRSALVTSTEPCAMCAAGDVWTGIGTIVYGLSAEGLDAITESAFFTVPSRGLLSHAKMPIKIVGPIFEPISAMVHQGFWHKI
jgi:tRNA(Arg) A34 adenosine deaminase TadA